MRAILVTDSRDRHRQERGGGLRPHPGSRRQEPGNNITGGKRRSGKTTKGDKWLADILVQCAWSAARARDTYLSAQFWRLARRIGKQKAPVAVARSILVACWHMLSNDRDDAALGGDWFTRRTNPDRHRDHLIEQLQGLGYRVTLDKLAARARPGATTLPSSRAHALAGLHH